MQLALSGQGLSEQQLNDYGLNFIRTQLITSSGNGGSLPLWRQAAPGSGRSQSGRITVKGLSALDVVNAISVQNLILPTGTSKIGSKEYNVDIPNAAPKTIADLNRIPIKTVGRHDHLHERRCLGARWISAANQHRAREWPAIRAADHTEGRRRLNAKSDLRHQVDFAADRADCPPQLKMSAAGGSICIRSRGAINGVVREAFIAACLTALMILIFLGSWRSTLIIATSIPLAILTSIIVLSLIGQTINIMTLGGLALAVGILVDDATVEVENINRNREAEPDKDMDEVDSRQRHADCDSGLRFDTFDLHRVRADVPAVRRGALSLSAAGRGGRIRHAGLLFPVADHRSHHGQVPSSRTERSREQSWTSRNRVGPTSARIRIGI